MSLIDKLEIFNSMSQEEKNNLSLFCQEKKLIKGEKLFSEGDDATAMYILEEGKIAISKKFKQKELLLGNVNPEEVLGEMALFGGEGKRMATAKAIEDCNLLVILSFSIKKLTFKYPELLKKIRKIIEERTVSNKKIEEEIRNI